MLKLKFILSNSIRRNKYRKNNIIKGILREKFVPI